MRNKEEFESYVREIAEHKITVRKRVMRSVAAASTVVILGVGVFTAVRVVPAQRNKADAVNEIAAVDDVDAENKAAGADGITENAGNCANDEFNGCDAEKYRTVIIKNLSDGSEITLSDEKDIKEICELLTSGDGFTDGDSDDEQIDSVNLSVPEESLADDISGSTVQEINEAGFQAVYQVELKDEAVTQTVLISADSAVMYKDTQYPVPGITEKMGKYLSKAD